MLVKTKVLNNSELSCQRCSLEALIELKHYGLADLALRWQGKNSQKVVLPWSGAVWTMLSCCSVSNRSNLEEVFFLEYLNLLTKMLFVCFFTFYSGTFLQTVLSYVYLRKGVESAILLSVFFLRKHWYFYLTTDSIYFCHLWHAVMGVYTWYKPTWFRKEIL